MMGCRKCKNRKFARNEKQQKELLSILLSGFGKIKTMDPNTRLRKEYICTMRPDYLPQEGTLKHGNFNNTVGSSVFNFWALNKNVGSKLAPEAGWVTIPAKQITFFEVIGSKQIDGEE